MNKLKLHFKHCLEIAEEAASKSGLKLSKGIMDVPGLADSQGKAPFLEYPILTSEAEGRKFRIIFTYESDVSRDIDGKNFLGTTKEFKTPWLRIIYLLNNEPGSFFRIYKCEKTFMNKMKNIFQIIPGEEVSVSGSTEFSYYLLCPVKSSEMKQKLIVSDVLQKLGSFQNLRSVRIDSREFIADIECDKKESYTAELILNYIDKIDQIMPVLIKM